MGRITRIGVPKHVLKAVDNWSDDIIKDVKRVVRETALMLERELKLLMPEDTGEMKDSITVVIAADGLSAHLRVGVFYAINVCRPYW